MEMFVHNIDHVAKLAEVSWWRLRRKYDTVSSFTAAVEESYFNAYYVETLIARVRYID